MFTSYEELRVFLCVAGGEDSWAAWGSRNCRLLWSTDNMSPQCAGPGFALAYPIQGGCGLAETLLENSDGSSGFALWSAMSQGWWLSSTKTTGQFSNWPSLLTLKSSLDG